MITNPEDGADLARLRAGLTVNSRYRLEAEHTLSRHVKTWRATDLVLSRPVLIHVLGGEDPRLGAVLQAARHAAIVNDSRFLAILDALASQGQEPWSFVVCEFPVGDSLASLLLHGPLESQQAAFIVTQVAAALSLVHAEGLHHLRLHPDLIVITASGSVKIAGLLIDAALRPQPGEETLTSHQREAVDVHGLGALLYCCLTARWPISPLLPQHPLGGLLCAPLMGLPPAPGGMNEQTWPAPHELVRTVDPRVSAIAMHALTPHPSQISHGFARTQDVARALDPLVDDLAAVESLEALVRRFGLSDQPSDPVYPAPNSIPDDERPTAAFTPGDLNAPRPSQPRPMSDPDPADSRSTLVMDAVPAEVAPEPYPVARTSSRGRRKRVSAGTLILRWLLVIAAVAALVIGVLQMRSCSSSDPDSEEQVEESTQLLESRVVEIVSGLGFDPPDEGGAHDEQSAQAPLAFDGDPATAWHTFDYYTNPKFGGLKPGAGLMVDLGELVPVTEVDLLFDNEPNQFQLMVPASQDANASGPPLDSVSQWQIVTTGTNTGRDTKMALDRPVETRWLLVYLTSLPVIGEGTYRTGIAEITVRAQA